MVVQGMAKFRWISKDALLAHMRKSISDFMTVFAGLEPDQEPISSDPADPQPAVTAVVGFNGDFQGVLWVRCSEPLAVRIAAGMTGGRPAGVDKNVLGAVGEMASIFGEEIKIFLSPRKRDLTLTIPSVFRGDDPNCRELMDDPERISCSFIRDGEPMLVGMLMKRSL